MEAGYVLTRADAGSLSTRRRASAKGLSLPTVHSWPARGPFCASAEPLLAGGRDGATSHRETTKEKAPTTT